MSTGEKHWEGVSKGPVPREERSRRGNKCKARYKEWEDEKVERQVRRAGAEEGSDEGWRTAAAAAAAAAAVTVSYLTPSASPPPPTLRTEPT
eukprot:402043-Hanusia_phi.AAC.1